MFAFTLCSMGLINKFNVFGYTKIVYCLKEKISVTLAFPQKYFFCPLVSLVSMVAQDSYILTPIIDFEG